MNNSNIDNNSDNNGGVLEIIILVVKKYFLDLLKGLLIKRVIQIMILFVI
jgi:hypothetical protein